MNKIFIIKRSLACALAVFLAVIAAHFYARAEKCWLPIAALLVMQTPIGLALRQGVVRFLEIAVSLIVISLSVILLQNEKMLLLIIAAIVLSVCSYFINSDLTKRRLISFPFVFTLVLVALLLQPIMPISSLYFRLYDVTLGAGIGLLVNLFILPARADVEFRKNIIPVLNAYADYFAAIMNLLFRRENAVELAKLEEMNVEKSLQTTATFFPIWVYESGLSVAFRQGHRHFLVMIERVSQILFSLHHIAKHEFDPLLIEDLEVPITQFLGQAEKVLIALTIVMSLGQLSEGVSDLTEEMLQLENAFKNAVPVTLELIDMSEDYILCAALIEELKDLRITLIRLGQALRSVPS